MVRIQLFSFSMYNSKKNPKIHNATTLSSLSSFLHLKKSTLSSLLDSTSSKPTITHKKKINKERPSFPLGSRVNVFRRKLVFTKVNTLLTSDFRLLKILASNTLLSGGRRSVYSIFRRRHNVLLSGRKIFRRIPVSSSNELAALGISWRFYRSVLVRLHSSTSFTKSKFSQPLYHSLNAGTFLGVSSSSSEYTDTPYVSSSNVLTFPDYWLKTTRFSLCTVDSFSDKLNTLRAPVGPHLPSFNFVSPVFLSWVAFWTSALVLYSNFSATPFVQRYLKDSFIKIERPTHQLRFRFNKSRLTLALFHDSTMKPYFQISSGVFMKFFQKKKSMRRSRTLKVLMLRFLRKLLLLIKLPRIHLYVSGVPALLGLLLETLHKPLPHAIIDPLTKRLVDEVNEPESFGSFSQITFNDSKPFGIVKQKKRGRVKRKIRRKLQRISKQIDK